MLKHFLYAAAILVLTMIFDKSWAQEDEVPKDLYIASTIPDSLKENANAVVRYAIEEDEVNGPGKMVEKIHEVVTVLNEKARREAELELPYNRKFDSFSDVLMCIYDASGNVIKKYRKGDMGDYAANDGFSLAEDGRVLFVRHTIVTYPVTVETEYTYKTNSLFDPGEWNIQSNEQSVQNSYYHLSVDTGAGFRYLNKNTTIKPVITTINGRASYSWVVKNLKAIKLEEGAESWRVFPHVYFAQNKFSQEGYPGDISTWQNYGKWQKDLNADVCSLSPEREAEIRKMTDTIKTDKEKAKFLYQYMQQNVRYVSIQLGIGGWKPFAASFVDQKKYGDCKALSNYMSALLKAVGIKSCYAIINAFANQEPADPAFPFNHFNHVILCVPFKNDTTWLECTDNHMPFGLLSSFTENRRALIVTEDGGRLVNTPKSAMNNNQFNSEVHIVLNGDGSAKAETKILSTGEYRDKLIGLSALKEDEQKKEIIDGWKMKQPISFSINPGKDVDGTKEVDLNFEYDKFSDIMAGDKQFYRPHLFDLVTTSVPIEEHRKSDFYFDFPREGSCITTIDLPVGFEVESLPVNQSLNFSYGNYEVKYTDDSAKNEVTSAAKFTLTNHVIPAAKYTELQEYLDAVAKAQNKKLVIRRKA